ncbi:kinase-like domain-containing protein [Rhizophagus diaphanus]|nr:kinase-like domain-containing protein [Rhizophagus diaphanus] [Rhizophagus sp. MUCL 43196]
MSKLDTDLRGYLQQNHNKLTWKERIKIIYDVAEAVSRIHKEKAIHRDLHSGNILYCQCNDRWFISDLGFCGPANKPLECIYGNLLYIAPEVVAGKEYTFASDIYSIAMLMWEISSGQPPFVNYENNYNLAMDIVNGMRPKAISGIPLKYKELMEQCWDADPIKRPDITMINNKIRVINKLFYQNTPDNNISIFRKFLNNLIKTNNLDKLNNLDVISCYYASSKLSISKIYQFDNLPEPRNATEGNSKTLSKVFQKFHIGSRDNNQNNYKRETIKQKVKKQDIDGI